MKKPLGIYVHIPFCATRCGYCDFLTFACGSSKYEPYTKALIREIESVNLDEYEINTIFIGGGTPTVLLPSQIERILNALKKYKFSKNIEITIEANPGTLNLEMLRVLEKCSVNRISMGLQSTHHRILKRINRSHTFGDFLKNYKNIRNFGINTNVDLMFSLPGFRNFKEAFKSWVETLQIVSSLSPEHISLYSLIIEEGTPFFTQYEKGLLVEVPEEYDRRMYHFAQSFLAKKGYIHYEISNFSKKGYECRHNTMYWKCGEYKGFGLGSHSYFKGKRFNNVKDLDAYINSDTISHENIIDISQKDQIEEFMFLGLRLLEGINIDEFKEKFKVDIIEVYGKVIDENIKSGLLKKENNNISLTKTGLDISNRVMSDFLI